MKQHIRRAGKHLVQTVILLGLTSGLRVSAATLTVSPSVISNTYIGMVTLSIGGLTNGEAVLVEKYLDGNGNGVVDTGDLLWQSGRLTDGKMKTIGGATNWNVPGDLDGTSGNITANLNFTAMETDHIVSKYAFRLSSPYGRFTPVTNVFEITNTAYSQSFTGAVLNGASPVANAWVVLLVAGGGEGGEFYAGTIANASGGYSIKVPPGTYQLLAGKPGFVYDMAAAPVLTLATNTQVNTNLSILPSTRTLAGKVVDAGNTNNGLAGLFLFVPSSDGKMVIGSTDSNGNFSLPVTASQWRLSSDNLATATLGYVTPKDWPGFDTTAGDVTNALLALSKGTALFHGTILTEGGAPLPGTRFYADDTTNQTYEATGLSDANGNYAVAVLTDQWSVGADASSPSLRNYVVSSGTMSLLASNQAVRFDFIAKPATNRISGWVRDNSGNPVGGIGAYAFAFIGGMNYSTWTATDVSGDYSVNVADGSWHVGLECDSDYGLASFGFECAAEKTIPVPPVNGVANFTVYPLGTPSLDAPQFASPTQLHFALHGRPGTNYLVQYSLNPANSNGWNPLTNLTSTGLDTVWDNNATNRNRFYRARIGP